MTERKSHTRYETQVGVDEDGIITILQEGPGDTEPHAIRFPASEAAAIIQSIQECVREAEGPAPAPDPPSPS